MFLTNVFLSESKNDFFAQFQKHVASNQNIERDFRSMHPSQKHLSNLSCRPVSFWASGKDPLVTVWGKLNAQGGAMLLPHTKVFFTLEFEHSPSMTE